MQVLSLLSSVFKSGLGTRATLLRLLDFATQAILFLPKVTSSLLGSKVGLSLTVQVLASLLGPLLGNKNLSSDLRQKMEAKLKENNE